MLLMETDGNTFFMMEDNLSLLNPFMGFNVHTYWKYMVWEYMVWNNTMSIYGME